MAKKTQSDIDHKKLIDEIMKNHCTEIVNIFKKHSFNPFDDYFKHLTGIHKAMVEFAIYYNKHQNKEQK